MALHSFLIRLSFLIPVLLLFLPTHALAAGERIFKIGEDVVIEETMHIKSLCVINGQATISGEVDGDVIAVNGSVVLTKKAVVTGNVLSIGGVVVTARGAQIGGSVTEMNSAHLSEMITRILSDEWEGWSWLAAIFSLTVFLCTFIIGSILMTLIPTPIVRIGEAIHIHFWKSLWTGILVLVLIVPLAVLLTISVVGIVLIPLEVILVICTALVGVIGVSYAIGDRGYRLLKKSSGRPLSKMVFGLIIIWIIGWIPVVGWMLKVLLMTIGMGSAIFTRFGTAPTALPTSQ